MEKEKIEIIIGCLLHDIGKVLYRHNDGRNHSVSGKDFLSENEIDYSNILDQVEFHHRKILKTANLKSDSLAYITYWADNVAAAADRRNNDENKESFGFDRFVPLKSIFNILNGNDEDFSYNFSEIYDGEIPYPHPHSQFGNYNETIYGEIVDNIKEGLKAVELTEAYINSLLGVLEANLSFVPSSTDKNQLVDISLFDHMKITAAVGSCAYDYIKEMNEPNFKDVFFVHGNSNYAENMFQLFSMDISGIQSFLYQIDSKNALKTLRSKSFYLEIMLEHIIDELLQKLELSRANLIYSGGGHAYLVLPNTGKCNSILYSFEKELKAWFLKFFKTDLFVAFGSKECSANDFMDKPTGTYQKLFKDVSERISDKKIHRYTPDEFFALNNVDYSPGSRECRICGRVDLLESKDICELCNSFISMSAKILTQNFVTILSDNENSDAVRLPLDRYMVLESEDKVKKRMRSLNYIRSYSKNKMYTGFNLSTKLWVGDYSNGETFEELANYSKGIKRLGVLRADVDDMGVAFIKGFDRETNHKSYTSLSRSATFSRQLSMFFKFYINDILKNGIFSLEDDGKSKDRKVVIVYSGGDDVFIVGAWNHIIEAAIDINNALRKYTQNTLSISAGIGMFSQKYPVISMARKSGQLEEFSKNNSGKNSVTVFGEENRYHWDEFIKNVIGEKFQLLNEYLSQNRERGNAMLYKITYYIRNKSKRINLARFAYLLGRMEPPASSSKELKQLHRRFVQKLYEWVTTSDEDCRQLLTAIYLYVYINREGVF